MELNTKNIKKILLIITFAAIVFWGLQNYTTVLGGAGKIFGILLPFILGLCIAFILNVLLRMVEKFWDFIWKKKKNRGLVKKLQRPVCLLASIGIVFGAIVFLLLMVVPELSKTVAELVKDLPEYWNKWEPTLQNFLEKLGLSSISLPKFLDSDKAVSTVTNFFSERSFSLFSKTADITVSIFSGIFDLILGLVFSLYVLFQKEKLLGQFKKLLYAFIPEEKVDAMLDVAKLSDRIFTNFVTGQFTEAFIIGVLCYIGMLVLRIPYAAMISTLVGFTALVPIIGALIGTAVGAFLILMVAPIKALWFVIFILVLQQLEGDLIYPKVVGESVGLPGIWVLVAVTIGGSTYGIIGMLVSVPVCSVLYTLLQQIVNKRLERRQGTTQAKQLGV